MVYKLQSGNFVTERQTDGQGKNNMAPNPIVCVWEGG